ncbi:MAG: GNAT family N-acetyltransferase [Muribaculaceae bacterium]|nr:GNAT family N-acetyltransferase [Muribaculaceae bacterium]
MEKIKDVKAIYREAFDDSMAYVEMYFNRVYREEDACVGYDPTGKIVSSLLLQQYEFNFGDNRVSMGYIAGAATRKSHRGQGYMGRLLNDALNISYERGDQFCALIPAHRWLYDYYNHFGFSTVFYIQEKRYTSVHEFNFDGEFERIDNIATPEIYETFNTLNNIRRPCVAHSYEDYLNIIEDNRMDNGLTFALRDKADGMIVAIVFAVVTSGRVVVRDLLAVDPNVESAALAIISDEYPEMGITVIAPAEDTWTGPIESRGMMRIVNALEVLKTLAATDNSMKMKIRVQDKQIQANNHIYVIDRGNVVINDGYAGSLDLDVTVGVLSAIIFSAPKVGSIFNLQTHRPFISLMLD